MVRHFDQHGGGVKVYTHNLLRQLAALSTDHELVYIYRDPAHIGTYGNARHVREVSIETPRSLFCDALIRKRMEDVLWDQFAVPIAEKREGLDLIFNPKYSLPLRAKCPAVFVCHGLPAHVMPSASRWFDRLNYSQLLPRYAAKASAIIAVSNTARDHAIKYLGVDKSRVHTVYLGVGEEFSRPVSTERLEEIRRRYRLPERFFLFCGQIYPPKNFGRLVQAYAKVGPKLGTSLVVAGQHSESKLCTAEIESIDRLGISSWVVKTGWVDHDVLPAFYALAHALILPSLTEACPSPVLEAMASGCPVVTANRHGTLELAGTAAVLVDPEDVQSIADGIYRVSTDCDLRRRLIRKGYARVRNFSWRKCAEETLQVIEEVGCARGLIHTGLTPKSVAAV